MKRRVLPLLAAASFCGGLLIGCGQAEQTAKTTDKAAETTAVSAQETAQTTAAAAETGAASETLFAEKTTINMTVPNHDSWPYNEEWYLVDTIEKVTNTELDVTAIPMADYETKVQLYLSSGEVPDLMYLIDNAIVFEYGPQGAFVNLLEYKDQMPNFSAWLEANPERAALFMTADGAMYCAPEHGVETVQGRGWMYRQDVFEELGLEIPTTQQEFYDVLVALKEAYPDSYPLALRQFNQASGMTQLCQLAASWGTHYMNPSGTRTYHYYDYDANEWVFGPTSPEFKELVTFYKQLYDEELILPNYMTVDTAGWVEAMTNGTSFITYDFLSRILSLTEAGVVMDEDYFVEYMPPAAMGTKGEAMTKFNASGNYCFSISAQCKNLDAVLKYVDWLYTDEAMQLVSWGEEGVYAEKDAHGQMQWKDEVLKGEVDTRLDLGIETYGMYLRYDINAKMASNDPRLAEAYMATAEHTLPDQPTLAYTEDEEKVMEKTGTAIFSYVEENIAKFLLGKRSLDEWDAYVAEVEALGLDDVKAVQEAAYARQLESLGK